jgi:hypothetical protein
MTAPASAALEAPPAPSPRQWTFLRRLFTADVRSLAAMRIGTALVVLFDLWDRAQHLTAHYTDAGVLPRAIFLAESTHWIRALSFHLLGGSFAFQAALFLLSAAVAALLLVGYRTRLATIATYVLLVSLHARNPFVLFGGDSMLKMTLFWGMFLPWGAVFSLDRRRAARHGVPPPSLDVCSTGVAASMIQIGIVYLFTALTKTGAAWRTDFTAIYWALSIEDYVGWLGPGLYAHPGWMKALTAFSFGIAAASPLLLFLPFWTRPARMVAILGLAGLHFGILLTMRIGFFPVICIVTLFQFFPGTWWDLLGRRFRRARPEAQSTAPERTGGLAALIACLPLLLIGYVLAWNVGLPAPLLRAPGRVLAIHQSWRMFAPSPFTDNGWFVLVGTLADGRQVDLMRGGAPVDWTERHVKLRGERVRKFYRRLYEKRGRAELRGFGAYLCRSGNTLGARGSSSRASSRSS